MPGVGAQVGDLTVPRGLYDGATTPKVRGTSGRDADNNIIVFWDDADGKGPADAASCWMYVSRLNNWDENY